MPDSVSPTASCPPSGSHSPGNPLVERASISTSDAAGSSASKDTRQPASELPRFVYRIQDRKGRGPFKPGKSQRWVDNSHMPPGYKNVAGTLAAIRAARVVVEKNGGAIGCAFTSVEDAANYFNATEYRRLRKLGDRFVRLSPDDVLASWDHGEVLVWRAKGFRRGVKPMLLHRMEAA